MTNLGKVYIRGGLQMIGLAAVVAGGAGWIAGRPYGHGLLTLGLIGYVCTIVPGRRAWYGAMGFHSGRQGAKSFRAGQFEESADHLAEQVRHLRKLAFMRPSETSRLYLALTAQWTALTKLGRHAEALVVAEEAVVVGRLVDAGRPRLDQALELVETSLGDFADEPIGPEAGELLALRAQLAGDADRAQARSLALVAERHMNRREYDAARPLLEQAVRIHRHLASGPKLVAALNDLGTNLLYLDEPEQARASYAEGLRIALALDPAAPDDVFALQVNLGTSLRDLRRYAEVVPLQQAVVAKLRTDHQSENRHERSLVRLTAALGILADDLRELGRHDETPPLEEEIAALMAADS
ncbi:tetratricopeptide repeat protein [Kribbella sp. NPDC003505]|uniref:tetratricopeptide repeat protein n=1 Tax=Kribbella sp. NPDC003505 TaxID=3154448 RepID=UPI0033ABB6DD